MLLNFCSAPFPVDLNAVLLISREATRRTPICEVTHLRPRARPCWRVVLGKCPFFAHIRKVNPRSSGGFEPPAGERLHIMPRRGQTYGVRTDDPNDGKIWNKPTKDVGLLFMAFNANIAEQFEFAQKSWANFAGFPKVPAGRLAPGLDMVIGQGNRPDIDGPTMWGANFGEADQHKVVAPAPQNVTMKGGEYFFMPSMPTLSSL